MRTHIAMLAVLAGLGVSGFGTVSAEAKNLSCISEISPSEQRLLRDCEPEPVLPYYAVLEVPDEPPPPPLLPNKNGEGGKGGGTHGRDKDHDAPGGGGDPSGPHGAAN